ncbi:MAG TPA: hypothetical protein VHG92_12750, partial [Afifellaceae bacterium]|nr:hypothetical protein [Afifellaceae bacterium]
TAAALAAAVGPAEQPHAHDWYPNACCQDVDCAPLADNAIFFSAAGWHVLETGEIIPLDDNRVRLSPDRNFHRCRLEFWERRSGTRCLFIPVPDS